MTLPTHLLFAPLLALTAACAAPGVEGGGASPPANGAGVADGGGVSPGSIEAICAATLRQYAPLSSGYDKDISIRFVDTSAVAITDASGREILAAGSAPANVPFASGDARTGARTSGSYDVRIARGVDGSLSLVWKSTLPLVTGDRDVVVTTSGELSTIGGTAAMLGYPAAFSRDRFEITLCAFLYPVRDDYRPRVGSGSPEGCSGTPIRFTSPWSNVAEIHETSTYMRGFGACQQPSTTRVVYPQPK